MVQKQKPNFILARKEITRYEISQVCLGEPKWTKVNLDGPKVMGLMWCLMSQECLSDLNMPKCAIIKVHLKELSKKERKILSLTQDCYGHNEESDKLINQSLQGG